VSHVVVGLWTEFNNGHSEHPFTTGATKAPNHNRDNL
jgi:hypothetical protein